MPRPARAFGSISRVGRSKAATRRRAAPRERRPMASSAADSRPGRDGPRSPMGPPEFSSASPTTGREWPRATGSGSSTRSTRRGTRARASAWVLPWWHARFTKSGGRFGSIAPAKAARHSRSSCRQPAPWRAMRILIVDDDAGLRQSLGLLLKESGYDVTAEADPEQALVRAGTEPFDLILCDVRMPRVDGLAFLRRYRADGGDALLIMMSAFGSEDAALAAMREGADDYLHKPFRPDEVIRTVRTAEERERLRREVATLRATLGPEQVRDLVVAESRPMRELLELASRVAAHNTTVLLTGESGTGKEVLARAIHRMSPRSGAAFTAINCAAIPEQLLESELFGHVRGAFTGAATDRQGIFETAHEGTLLLDEIGDLPIGLQAKLLRVLEEGEIRRLGAREGRRVDVRVIAATAKPLDRAVERGEFRDDLYYRLNVVNLHIPPLRERREDIGALVAHFARQAA